MPRDEAEALFAAYERELMYLRNEGAEFARAYPRVAGRLDFNGHESRDPHTERLLESFAFLTARIQRTLDAEFPLIPSALLDTLYPALMAPVPSAAIAHFEVDPDQARAAQGFHLPDNIALHAESPSHGLTCRFNTCYPVKLWPVQVVRQELMRPEKVPSLARLGGAAVWRLRLRAQGNLTFADMQPDRLRLFLDGEPAVAGPLMEMLLDQARAVVLAPAVDGAEPTATLKRDCLSPVGFAPEEDLLRFPAHAHQGYRLIREYFVFPQKFLFLDVDFTDADGNPAAWPTGSEVDLFFLLDQQPERAERLERVTVRLNCAPIINLFPKTSEPLRLDQTQSEYRLLPDSRWERSTEIHSIQKVSAVMNRADETALVRPFFSYDHMAVRSAPDCFWMARRRPTVRADMPGTDMFLSFVDLALDPSLPPTRTLFAHTLCTNRGMAEQLPPDTVLNLEVDAPVREVRCLTRPTPQISAPEQGETLWQLVSALTLNHLSLADDGSGSALRALREIMVLYGEGCGLAVHQQAGGITALSSRPVTRRLGDEAWRGFVRGTEISLTIDESQFAGGSAYLLASVLDRFLALYGRVNNFTQLVLNSVQREGVWKRWPARVGERNIL